MPAVQRVAIMECAVRRDVRRELPFRDEGSEGHQELRMDSDTLRVQRRDAGGREDHEALVRAARELMQEGGLAGAGLSSEENVPRRAVDKARGERGHFGGLQDGVGGPVSYTHLTLPTSDLV